jgi:hypothetical protein
VQSRKSLVSDPLRSQLGCSRLSPSRGEQQESRRAKREPDRAKPQLRRQGGAHTPLETISFLHPRRGSDSVLGFGSLGSHGIRILADRNGNYGATP